MQYHLYICSIVITKLMIKMEEVTRLEQLKSKMQVGDYMQLAKMLDCTRDAAKMRLRRGDTEAIKGLQTLIENREQLIQDFQAKNLNK